MEQETTNISFDRKNGAIIAVAIVLVIAASVLVYTFWDEINNNQYYTGYSTIYLLDTNNQAENYPEVLIANKNSTFTVNLGAENHKTSAQDFKIKVKITQEQVSFPVNAPEYGTYEKNALQIGESWSTQASVTINQAGDYAVVFELWAKEVGNTSDYVFTENSCILKIQVKAQ